MSVLETTLGVGASVVGLGVSGQHGTVALALETCTRLREALCLARILPDISIIFSVSFLDANQA